MQVSTWGFPRPFKIDDAKPGDLFVIRDGEESWLLLAAADGYGTTCYLVLDGPPEPGISGPRIIGEYAVRGAAARLPDLQAVIEPLGDTLPHGGDKSTLGALTIDAEGGLWVDAYGPRDRVLVSLHTGKLGQPAYPRQSFARWRLVLRDGERTIPLISFGDD